MDVNPCKEKREVSTTPKASDLCQTQMTIHASQPSASGYPVPGHYSEPGHEQQSTVAHSRVVKAAMELLIQGESLLTGIDMASYARRVPMVFNASIGGHYRHCLDHFSCLLHRGVEGVIDYDHRERDGRIEQEPVHALAATRQLLADLRDIDPAALERPVMARCEVSYESGDSPVTASTVGRELVYAIAHGIHHYAMISVIARLQNIGLPEDFGVAPSTVAHLKKIAAV
jgi:hypothetical protein